MKPIQIGGSVATARYLIRRASSFVSKSRPAISQAYARLQNAMVMRRKPYQRAPRMRCRESAYHGDGDEERGPAEKCQKPRRQRQGPAFP